MPEPTRCLLPLVLLPPEQRVVRPLTDTHFGVGIFNRNGALHLQKWSVLDFPNAFFGIKDLENAGLLETYMTAVDKLKNRRAV